MPKARRVEIAKAGNAKLRELKLVHQFDAEKAASAGAKGGRRKAHPEERIFEELTEKLRLVNENPEILEANKTLAEMFESDAKQMAGEQIEENS